jgi:hypothetical protein
VAVLAAMARPRAAVVARCFGDHAHRRAAHSG